MNTTDRIRRKIEASKRQSFFNLIPIEDSVVITPSKTSERKRTSDSDSNFTLFPVIDCNQMLSDRRNSLDQEKIDLFPNNKNQQRSFLRQKKVTVHTARDQFHKNRKIYFETVANVTELKAKSLAPALRINRSSNKRNTYEIRAKKIDYFAFTSNISVSEEAVKQKSNPERKSPLRRNNRPSLRGRRISPRKNLSPISPMRKFSISAWETGQEPKNQML